MSETTEALNEADQNKDNVNSDIQEKEKSTNKDTVAYETYSRTLGKLKKTETRIDDLSSELQGLKDEKLAGEGKKDELIVSLKSRVSELTEDRDSKVAAFAYSTLSGQIEKEALKMGCQDSELLMLSLGKGIEELNVDDGFKGDSTEIQQLLEKIKKAKPILFSKSSPHVADGVPNSQKTGDSSTSYLEELKACTTQKEFDDVRKKYGKIN